MARQGRAGPALGISAFGSFIAGTIGVLGLSFLAPPLVEAALTFGPPEYFALMCLGLTVLTFLAQRFHAQGFDHGCFGSLRGNDRPRHHDGNAAFHSWNLRTSWMG